MFFSICHTSVWVFLPYSKWKWKICGFFLEGSGQSWRKPNRKSKMTMKTRWDFIAEVIKNLLQGWFWFSVKRQVHCVLSESHPVPCDVTVKMTSLFFLTHCDEIVFISVMFVLPPTEWRSHCSEEALHQGGDGQGPDGEEPVQGAADGAAGGRQMDWDDSVSWTAWEFLLNRTSRED